MNRSLLREIFLLSKKIFKGRYLNEIFIDIKFENRFIFSSLFLDSYKISLSMENIITNFSLNNMDNDQTKVIETIVKNVEDLRKWPKCMLKYPQKNNNKEYSLYHELAGTFIYCIVFNINRVYLNME